MEPLRRILHRASASADNSSELLAATVIGAVNDVLQNNGSPLSVDARAVSFRHHRVTIEVQHAAVAAIIRARADELTRAANTLLARRLQNYTAVTITDIQTRVV